MSPNEITEPQEEELPVVNYLQVAEYVFNQPREVVAAALQGSPETMTKTQVEEAIDRYLQTPADEG